MPSQLFPGFDDLLGVLRVLDDPERVRTAILELETHVENARNALEMHAEVKTAEQLMARAKSELAAAQDRAQGLLADARGKARELEINAEKALQTATETKRQQREREQAIATMHEQAAQALKEAEQIRGEAEAELERARQIFANAEALQADAKGKAEQLEADAKLTAARIVAEAQAAAPDTE